MYNHNKHTSFVKIMSESNVMLCEKHTCFDAQIDHVFYPKHGFYGKYNPW